MLSIYLKIKISKVKIEFKTLKSKKNPEEDIFNFVLPF